MFHNYTKIAWRNLIKHKSFSLVNIFGLAIGIAACLVIFIYVRHELTFDQYNTKASRIARITATVHAPESDIAMAPCPALLAPTVEKEYPEVAAVVRLERSTEVVRLENNYLKEEDFYRTDPTIFTVFDFEVLEGSLAEALTQPNTIVITDRIAKKYFGKISPVGKMMSFEKQNRLVKAVVKDRPANTDLKIDAFLSHDFSTVTEWMDGFSTYTFVMFHKNTDLKAFQKKLITLSKKYVQPEFTKVGAPDYTAEFLVEPLSDVHFSKGKHDDTPKGNREYNYVFSILAAFILLIALLNYINLSTAKAAERAKEVGIRKVSGALPAQLIKQFLFESLLLISIAWMLSILIVYFSVPFINSLLQTTLSVQWKDALLFTAIVVVITFLLAGLYPAFVLASFKPAKVLKGSWRNTPKGILLRKTITVTQFAIAAALIMGATVIYNHMRFLEKKDLGFSKDQLMNIYLPRDSTHHGSVKAFLNDLRQQPSVKDVTIGGGMVTAGLVIGNIFVEDKGKKREVMCNLFAIDPHFLTVFKLQLVEGRNISDTFETDKKESFLVNEAFVKMMGWKSGLGKVIDGWGKKGKVVGVVKNFYYKSLHNLVEPVLMTYNEVSTNITTVNISPKNLPVIKDIYSKHFPTIPIDYSFFDEIISRQYEKDRITMSLFNNFTLLAIFISCLGLYGLVSLITIHRTKEVGIRKVLGASLSNLLMVLSGSFIKLVFISLLIALPAAGILMHKWLESYAYHEPLSWWMFVVPALVVLLVAIVVIASRVFRIAISNPVDSLRLE